MRDESRDDGRYMVTIGGVIDRAEVARCQVCGPLELGAKHDEAAHEAARARLAGSETS